MKIYDILKMCNKEEMARIIGAVVTMLGTGISAEEALKIDYNNTEKLLDSEMDVDYKPTNADRIRSMSNEELAEFIAGLNEHCLAASGKVDCSECIGTCQDNCKRIVSNWLQSEAEQ